MKLTVLGSGLTLTSPGTSFRYPAAHLVETENEKILFDASVAVLPQLAKLGIALNDIDAICITHFHADHFVLEPILQALYLHGLLHKQEVKVRLLGPTDIEERVRTAYKTKGWTFDDDLLKYADVTFTPYEGSKPVQIGQSTLIPYKTTHFALEAYALRIEENGKAIAYSGDSGLDDALGKAAKDADIFLCEAFQRVGEASTNGHVGCADAGKIAAEQNVNQLVITHYSGLDTPEAMAEEAKGGGFTGEVSIAQDLSTYQL